MELSIRGDGTGHTGLVISRGGLTQVCSLVQCSPNLKGDLVLIQPGVPRNIPESPFYPRVVGWHFKVPLVFGARASVISGISLDHLLPQWINEDSHLHLGRLLPRKGYFVGPCCLAWGER